MPFDAAEVARQIEASRGGVRAEEHVRLDALDLARRIYEAVGEVEWDQRVQDAAARRWVATPLSPLHDFAAHHASSPDYSVVATDSSFIAPDKHRGALSHLINVGRVMVLYGDYRAAEIDNTPSHYPEMPADDEEAFSSRVLSAKCALRELQELYEWARHYRADLALVDGSLMQLVHVLSKEAQVEQLMSEYLATLRAFEEIEVPVVGYISQPASGMVMRAIRLLACEQEIPHEQRPEGDCTCRPLWSIDDGDFFDEMLADSESSPVFQGLYRDLKGPNANIAEEVVFAYLGTQHEIARLEFPLWVANKSLLDRTIGIILHQCRLGRGYPNALLLAHQYAVLHNADRESYYLLLDRAGRRRRPTEKAQGKRAVGQSI
jgi:NurA domain